MTKSIPIREINGRGIVTWKVDDILHRDDGPALEYPDGYRVWYQNGKQHREDGPAVIWPSGNKQWFYNGFQHREDGPAVEYVDGGKRWLLFDKEYNCLEWMLKLYELGLK